MVTLRPDQQDFKQNISNSLRTHKRVLGVAPTGFGKGWVIADMVNTALQRDHRVLIVAHREEITSDLSERIHHFGINHGRIASAYREDLSHPVQVASVDTIIRRLHRIPPFTLILQDEAHHLVQGNKWGRIIDAWPDAYLVGLTATPERLDGRGLGEGHGGYFQQMVLGPTTQWLTDEGHLSPLIAYLPPVVDLSKIPRDKIDTPRGRTEEGEILRQGQAMGDVISHYLQTIAPHHKGTALAYCSSLAHSECLCQEFRNNGISAIAIDGETDRGVRKKAFRDLADGSLKVLLNVEIAGEGTDVPGVTGVIIHRRTKSRALHRQMLGRAVRTEKGKEFAVANDHVGNIGDILGNRNLGYPTDPIEWSLEGRKKRKKAPSEATPVKTCGGCFANIPSAMATVCPVCGWKFPVIKRGPLEIISGELQAAPESLKALERRKAVGQARTREELEAVRLERGYKPGWVDHILSSRKQRAQQRHATHSQIF